MPARSPRRHGAFTGREIQLVLLRRMADLQAPLVDEVLRRTAATRDELREANRRWNAAQFGRRVPVRWSRYARALGPAVVDRVPLQGTPMLRAAGLVRSCWPVPFWPGFWLQVLTDGPGGTGVVQHLSLVRARDSAASGPAVRDDVLPWTCTLAECAAAFGEVTFHDVGLTGHEALTCTAPRRHGPPVRLLVRGVWGLVQRADEVRP